MTLDSVLAILSALGELAVLLFLIRRKVWRILPLFSVYVLWTLGSDVALLYLRTNVAQPTFFKLYLVEVTVDALLMFCVLVELLWSILLPVRASLPRATVFVLGALVAIAGMVIWPLAGMTISSDLGPEGRLLFHLEETFSILRVVLFLIMASFSQILSIGWRDRELQVATGLGIYSIVSLLVTMLHSHQTVSLQYHWLDVAVSISYLCTLSYWVLSFSAKQQKRQEFSPQMQQFLVLMGAGVRANRIALADLPDERQRKKD